MLNGVGGCTIEEAQQRLSYTEFRQWCEYRSRRGSLNAGLHVESNMALLTALYANSKSKRKFKQHDFAPHYDEPPVSLEDAMKEW